MVCILFTYPNCPKCTEVKKYLKTQEIPYEEINAGIGEGKKRFQTFYRENRGKIKRDEHETISLPILVCDEKISQGLENIINKPCNSSCEL